MSRVLEILQPHCGELGFQAKPFAVELQGRRFVCAATNFSAVALRSDEIASAPPPAPKGKVPGRDPSYLALPSRSWSMGVAALVELCDQDASFTVLGGVRVNPRLLAHVLGSVPGDVEMVNVGAFGEPDWKVVLWTEDWRATVAGCAQDQADVDRIMADRARRREVTRG